MNASVSGAIWEDRATGIMFLGNVDVVIAGGNILEMEMQLCPNGDVGLRVDSVELV